MEVNPGK
jgi:hypothetical protein